VGTGGAEEPGRVGRTWHHACGLSTGNALLTRYIGRPDRSSPAEGYAEVHKKEQERIIDEGERGDAVSGGSEAPQRRGQDLSIDLPTTMRRAVALAVLGAAWLIPTGIIAQNAPERMRVAMDRGAS